MRTELGSGDRRQAWRSRPVGESKLPRLSIVAPLVLLGGGIFALTLYCRFLLAGAAAGRAPSSVEAPLFVAAGGFLLLATAAVVLQAVRFGQRVAGPEYRLQQALQRMRNGDLSFRVHLRRDDLLSGLAAECNALLEWLNDNPPPGSRTGSDVVDLELVHVPDDHHGPERDWASASTAADAGDAHGGDGAGKP